MRSELIPKPEKKIWLFGLRFWLILCCLLINIAILVSLFALRSEGCVICLYTKNAPDVSTHKKSGLSNEGIQKFLTFQSYSDEQLIASLTCEDQVGFGFTEGDIAASFLFERGFDAEPVLKVFSAWPMIFFDVPHEKGAFKIMSALTPQMRSELHEYFLLKKAPYQLGYVLKTYKEKQDVEWAEEALSHRTDVRAWVALFQTLHISKEDAWKTVLCMRKEAIEEIPHEGLAIDELLAYFDDAYPACLSLALLEYHCEECLSLNDQMIDKFLTSLDEHPLAKARVCFRLLQVPRKLSIYERAKSTLVALTKEEKLDKMNVQEMIAWARASQADKKAPPALSEKANEKKEEVRIAQAVPVNPAPERVPAPVAKPVKAVTHSQSTAPARFRVYIVQKGDTIWKIAQKFKVDPNKITSLNKLKKGQLEAGQKVYIPL